MTVIFISIFTTITLYLNIEIIQQKSLIISGIMCGANVEQVVLNVVLIAVCQFALFVMGYAELTFRTMIICTFRDQYTNSILNNIFKGKPDEILRLNKSDCIYYAGELNNEGVQAVFTIMQILIGNGVMFVGYLIWFDDILPVIFVLAMLVAYIVLFGITQQLNKKLSILIEESVIIGKNINTSLSEILDNIQEIQLSGINFTIGERTEVLLEKMKRNDKRITWVNTISKASWNIPSLLISLSIYIYIFNKILRGEPINLYFIALAVTNVYLNLFDAGFQIRFLYQKQHKIFGTLDRILEIRRQENITEEEGRIVDISIDKVSYRYGKILKYPNMIFRRPSITLIKGASGCGKTTLLRLIVGLLTPENGKVLYSKENGNKVVAINAKGQNNIAYVPQFCYIYNATVRYNVTLGEMYSEEEIIDALKKANAYEFIMRKSDRLETILDTNALSGGEKQRIALARAFIRKPSVLILDESFSNLDKNNAYSIVRKITCMDCICIMTAHQDFSALEDIIRIIDLEEESECLYGK